MNTAYDLTAATPALRKCSRCGLASTDNRRVLRKCRGCLAAPVYCSKECQRADWPIHRLSCTGLSKNRRDFVSTGFERSAQSVGYQTSGDLVKALYEFLDAHEWAFETSMMAHAILTHGVNLSDHPRDQILRCRLACTSVPNTGHGYNPAQGFRIVEFTYHSVESWIKGDLGTGVEYPDLGKVFTEGWKAAHEKFSARQKGVGCDHYVGLRAVGFTVDGVPASSIQFMPVYAVTDDTLPSIRGDARIALEDLLSFCTRSINSGQFVLKRPIPPRKDIGPWEAVPGRFLRREQNWIWEPLFEDWRDYQSGRVEFPALSVALTGLKTPPHVSMFLFRALWFHW
ncbi:hypothetical protein OH76DRAFT_1344475 [Lentinus brumalis]|uniref:MYND-type domain-containing protein n=1 Tax=Lentinus brumalis TaxID=2498619 RepID=A0A371DJV0_9APHY|nr:hypothetical protein OH76DRAFT_1344475 [Polyporus brumalis]